MCADKQPGRCIVTNDLQTGNVTAPRCLVRTIKGKVTMALHSSCKHHATVKLVEQVDPYAIFPRSESGLR
jgi:hypothetical protein